MPVFACDGDVSACTGLDTAEKSAVKAPTVLSLQRSLQLRQLSTHPKRKLSNAHSPVRALSASDPSDACWGNADSDSPESSTWGTRHRLYGQYRTARAVNHTLGGVWWEND